MTSLLSARLPDTTEKQWVLAVHPKRLALSCISRNYAVCFISWSLLGLDWSRGRPSDTDYPCALLRVWKELNRPYLSVSGTS